MAKLETYRRKRDFDRTPEPAGGRRRPARRGEGIFVVHKHDARRLHYDLRLERGGVLESWAVPKGPGFRPGDKRLAVRVEDHPLDYGDFEGVIPEGEYGGGTVMLWDRGRWQAGKREPGRLDFVLDGHKLRGAWTLTSMRGRMGGSGENWLLIKRRDERPAEKPDRASIDRSVASGRTMDEIAADRSREWTSEGESQPAARLPEIRRVAGARRRVLPRAPRAELATLVDRAPEGDEWIHEIKLDGYRILARKDGRRVTLFSRNGKDWTARFPELASRLTSVPASRVLLDGEVVLFEKNGTTSFRGLQEALSAGRTENLVYQVFDVLHVDGFDLSPVPLEERKRVLRALFDAAGFVGRENLRHPSFRGLREDKSVDEIRLPRNAAEPKAQARSAPAREEDGAAVAGVRLTHPDRILYPGQGVTKIELACYYEAIADWVLPGLVHRPVILVRCPEGHRKECFFQKHPREATAKRVPRVEIREKSGRAPYLYAESIADVVALVQTGALELHVWGSKVEDVERPDQLVFDLDPAPDVRWPEVLRVARELRDRLADLSLESFARTTGGKGLHVVVPLVPALDWEAAKDFARGVAEAHATDDPRHLTTSSSKAKRRGRVFLDYLRNARGATAIASYSTRAREGAPVATPLRWDELGPKTASDRYGTRNLRRRLSSLRADPWEGFDEARRPLTRAMLGRVCTRAGNRR